MLDANQNSGRICAIERKLIIPPGEDALHTGNSRDDWLYPTDDGTSGGTPIVNASIFSYDPNNGYHHNEAGSQASIPYQDTSGNNQIKWAGAGDGDYKINILGGVISLSSFSVPDVESSTSANDLLVGHASDGSWDAQTLGFGVLVSDTVLGGFGVADGDGVVKVVSGVSVTVDDLKIIEIISANGGGFYGAGNYAVAANGTGGTTLTPISGLFPDIESSTSANDLLVGSDTDGGWDAQPFGFGLLLSDAIVGGFDIVDGDGVVQMVSGTSVFVRDLAIVDIVSSPNSDGSSPYASGNYAVATNGSGGTTLTALGSAVAAYLGSLSGYGGGGALHDDLTWY